MSTIPWALVAALVAVVIYLWRWRVRQVVHLTDYAITILLDQEVREKEQANLVAFVRELQCQNEVVLSCRVSMAISGKVASLASWTMPLNIQRL